MLFIMDYSSTKWRKKRAKILRKDKYIDQIQLRMGRTVEATVVHHIYPAELYPEYQYSDWNLISISMETHNQLENRMTGELTAKGKELQRRTEVGKDFRDGRNKRHATSP